MGLSTLCFPPLLWAWGYVGAGLKGPYLLGTVEPLGQMNHQVRHETTWSCNLGIKPPNVQKAGNLVNTTVKVLNFANPCMPRLSMTLEKGVIP